MSNNVELLWDSGTAYDFFVSLEVLHEPDRYGLRGAWAAGVRSRLPAPERELLQEYATRIPWPLHWVHNLPAPKDARTVLREIAGLSPKERLDALAFGPYFPPGWKRILAQVTSRGTWDEVDLTAMETVYEQAHPDLAAKKKGKARKMAQNALEVWANASAVEGGLLAAFEAYYDEFFAEEELRIRAPLEEGLLRAQELAQKLPLEELLEELSQGVRIENELDVKRLILAPSFWATPYLLFTPMPKDTELWVFGVRPANASLVPGEVVPDALFQALKALADPTRLRILRYLAAEPLTPAELSRRLRLRAPTVIHHLDRLRLARLVQVSLASDARRYTARREAIMLACEMLEDFLNSENPSA